MIKEKIILPIDFRVRDYRRTLWGDSSAYVGEGDLGFINLDISVRERRRYTDILKEEPAIQKSVSVLDTQLEVNYDISRSFDGEQTK